MLATATTESSRTSLVEADDEWPPSWARTIRAHTNPALACPARRSGVDTFDVSFGGDAYWVLRRRETSKYLRVGPVEHDAWHAFDGVRTVLDIAKEIGRRHGVLALPVVESLVARLDQMGMLDDSPEDVVYTPLAMHFRGLGLAGKMLWVRQTLLLRRIAISGFGPLIDRSYRLVGRWFFRRPMLALLALVSLAGAFVTLRLGKPNPLTMSKPQFLLGSLLGIGTVVLHELAHAWTVRHFGREVHRAGVFLMYGMPGAFVDTTDMWLAPKRQRLWVTAAGPITNVVFGAVFGLLALAQPGLRPMWLVAASGNYLFVLANVMPLLKLDGYYLLMDAVGVAELRERGITFSVTKLVPRWREAWGRGDLLPRLGREERLLASYGTIALGAMVFLGASSILVLPKKIEKLVSQARSGEISGVPLAVMGTFTAVGLVLFVLNLVASRRELALMVKRAGRSLARLSAPTLLVAHAAMALGVAWLIPALAGRRDAGAGADWVRFSTAIGALIALRCATVLYQRTRDLAWRWLFLGAGLFAVLSGGSAIAEVPVVVRAGALTLLLGVAANARRIAQTLSGVVGGAWVLIGGGALATLAGRGNGVRTGVCLVAAGLLLARLVWTHPPARPVTVTDRPANEPFDDARDVRHLSRAVASVAASMLGRAVDVLGARSKHEIAFAFNARSAGDVDLWFTSDGRLTDRVTGTCGERGPAYARALRSLSDEVGERLGPSFAADGLSAAYLDLPDGLERLVEQHVLSQLLPTGQALGVGRDPEDARRLVLRHIAELPLQAARRVFGESLVESVVGEVNASTRHGVGLFLRGNGRLSIDRASISVDEAHDFLARVLGALSSRTGAAWARTSVQVALDALAWQLREATAGEVLVPLRWTGAESRGAGRRGAGTREADTWGVGTREADTWGVDTREVARPSVEFGVSGPLEREPASEPVARRRAVAIVDPVTSTSPERPEPLAVVGVVDTAPSTGSSQSVRRRAVAIGDGRAPAAGTTSGAGQRAMTLPVAVSHAPASAAPTSASVLTIPVLLGCVVALLLGVYAQVHPETGQSSWHPLFSRMITFKSWSATAALACAVFQVSSGTVVHRGHKTGEPSRLMAWHRLSGLVAFLLTLPVAFHCLWALGFAPRFGFNRVFAHSVAGCLLYGGYATKVLAVGRRGRPRWSLPVIGSVLFTAFSVTVATSAGWFFSTQGFQW